MLLANLNNISLTREVHASTLNIEWKIDRYGREIFLAVVEF
jgi:hypothetical protein